MGKVILADLNSSPKTFWALTRAMVKATFTGSGKSCEEHLAHQHLRHGSLATYSSNEGLLFSPGQLEVSSWLVKPVG